MGLRDAERHGGLFLLPPATPERGKMVTRSTPKKFHIDKRADAIAATATGNDDDLLSTEQMSAWFGVSSQWLEIRRHRGDGPPFERLGPRCVRYRRDKVKAWLDQRTHRSTEEYA
jgi:predicted DNA-binding transcriptional regulator AlpA